MCVSEGPTPPCTDTPSETQTFFFSVLCLFKIPLKTAEGRGGGQAACFGETSSSCGAAHFTSLLPFPCPVHSLGAYHCKKRLLLHLCISIANVSICCVCYPFGKCFCAARASCFDECGESAGALCKEIETR